IETADDVCALVARQADMMRLLRSVEELGLPDCWIGAGFIRNTIWDALHGGDRPLARNCDRSCGALAARPSGVACPAWTRGSDRPDPSTHPRLCAAAG